MDIFSITFIAFGLATDAFAVSITSGLKERQLRIKSALKIAIFFGSFQAVMPAMGWLAGLSLKGLVQAADHWIALGLLSFIGCKMIYESLKLEPSERQTNPLSLHILLMLSVATSIDALVVGMSFAFLKVTIVVAIVVIGVMTFCLSFLGVSIGSKFGHFPAKRIEILGGLILVGIGIKIAIDHMG